MKPAYIFWTTNSLEEAKTIIHALLDQRLIACASILPKVYSLYLWEGEKQEDEEVKVILKSKVDHFSQIESLILEKTSYEVPEITLIQLDRMHAPYQEWLKKILV